MNDILDTEVIESEPLSVVELTAQLLQDLIADETPDALADDFIDEFILAEREETPQILALLETDSATLAGYLKAVLSNDYQNALTVIDQRGATYIDGLKAAVKSRLVERAGV